MVYLDSQLQKRINEKFGLLQKLRPLPADKVKKLREQFAIEMTYNSNAIEGNSLTLKETFFVISEGMTIKGKPLKDHLEAKDHKEALEYLYGLIDQEKQSDILETTIRNLQKLVVKETSSNIAGSYRDGNVMIIGASHRPPDAFEVPNLMRGAVNWINSGKGKLHPVELAALAHHKIVYIHPFFDGNGRTARLLMNLLLMRAGYPLAVILKNDRKKYYQTLARADKEDMAPFVNFIARGAERSLDIYLSVLLPATSKDQKYFLLSEIAKSTPYSEKYLNLLARQGKIDAHKKDRNWLVSLESINDYIKNRQRQR
jgi:Fic family protein